VKLRASELMFGAALLCLSNAWAAEPSWPKSMELGIDLPAVLANGR
jgi:hypothetical protein